MTRARTRVKATVTETGELALKEDTSIYKRVTTCRGCRGGSLDTVLSLGTQFLVRFVPGPDLSLPKAPLVLVQCRDCGLLQLAHTVNPDLLFREFWYRSGINGSMRSALKDLVKSVVSPLGGMWLDIGANDGYLLSQVPEQYRRVACEPARNMTAELHRIADNVIPDYFTADNEILWKDTRTGGCDVITSAAMFYDLDDPDRFVGDVAKVLAPGGVWVNQLNDAPTMLRANAFDAICHEHLCYYDLASLRTIYERHGLVIVDVSYNDVNGGSVRVFAKKVSSGARMLSFGQESRVKPEETIAFAKRTIKWKHTMQDFLHGSSSSGKMWLYGASTKGCVLLQYLDSNMMFKAIADRNPTKHGLVMSGSWLPIVHEDEMRREKPRYLFVLPWPFKDEFIEREKDLRDSGTTMVMPLPNIEMVS